MFHSVHHVPDMISELPLVDAQYLAKIHDNNSPHLLPTSPVSPPTSYPSPPPPLQNNFLQDGNISREYREKLAQNNNLNLPHSLPPLNHHVPNNNSPVLNYPPFNHHVPSAPLNLYCGAQNPHHPPPTQPHQPLPAHVAHHPSSPHAATQNAHHVPLPQLPLQRVNSPSFPLSPLSSVTAAGLAHPPPSPPTPSKAQLGVKFSASQAPPGSPAAPVSLVAAPRFCPSGRRKALLVGINYNNTPAQLKGCVTDVRFLHQRLSHVFGFMPSDYVILADEPTHEQAMAKDTPTRANILHWLNWLVSDTQPGDSLWFSFSGHGSQTADLNGDEIDCLDEVILPLDHATAGFIVDDQLKEIASRICPGSRLTVLIDSCHSGTALDLPFQHDVFNSNSRNKSGRPRGRLAGLKHRVFSTSSKRPPAFGRTHRGQPTCGEIILFSGCMDNQKSADTPLLAGGVSTGAMTFTLCDALQHCNPGSGITFSYLSLLRAMRDKLLAKRLTQTPQFSTSCPFDLNAPFVL